MDMRQIKLNKRFDFAVCMWTTFNYLSKPDEVRSFLMGIYTHLSPEGILIMDVKNYGHELTYTRAQECSNDEYRVKLNVHKHRVDHLSEGIYIYEITDLKTKRKWFAIDQELNVIYSLKDILSSTKQWFKLIRVFGDYDISQEFNPRTSERIILVLQKKT